MIHYVVSVYAGPRGNDYVNDILSNNPFHYIDIQCERLKRFGSSDISRVTFVVSPSGNGSVDKSVCEYATGIDLGFTNTESYIRENNKYYSYGSWENCITKNISNLDFFLVEDDYFPASKTFYQPFVDALRSNENAAYACQMYKNRHAAISNGLLSFKAALKHLEAFGESLTLKRFDDVVYPKDKPTQQILTSRERRRALMKPRQGQIGAIPRGSIVLHPGVFAQERFLFGYEELGFDFVDLIKEYKHPFLQSGKHVINYGKKEGKTLLECEFYKR